MNETSELLRRMTLVKPSDSPTTAAMVRSHHQTVHMQRAILAKGVAMSTPQQAQLAQIKGMATAAAEAARAYVPKPVPARLVRPTLLCVPKPVPARLFREPLPMTALETLENGFEQVCSSVFDPEYFTKITPSLPRTRTTIKIYKTWFGRYLTMLRATGQKHTLKSIMQFFRDSEATYSPATLWQGFGAINTCLKCGLGQDLNKYVLLKRQLRKYLSLRVCVLRDHNWSCGSIIG